MFDKELMQLIGGNKKYVVCTVLLMILGMLANIGITASVCRAVYFLIEGYAPLAFVYPAVSAAVAIAVRYVASRCTGSLKDVLGRKVKKDLRERTYNKILRLGVRSTDGMSMAGLTQISMEGIEQLDLYYSAYLPQFFFSMIAPLLLFCICVGIDWRTSLVLLACVPLIPVSIIAVSKYAKRIFAKYWGKYTSMGDAFLDSVQGLKELKIFKADAARHVKMNQSAEEFRKITMKVLVMQLMSTTIMDLVAFGGAGAGVALSVVGLMNGWLAPASALFLILVAVEFFLPLRSLGSAFHVAMNGASAGKKIISLLKAEEPVWGEKQVSGTRLGLENVTFSYDGKRDVLKNVNMVFPEKGMTAIVGESGCGKSTVVNLLVGARRPASGAVTAGGENIESFSRESYYAHIASVSYNTYIFNDTVRANFELAKKEVSDGEIWAALEKVNLADFIRENGGLDKVVAEDANNVSGGQKQRLALAVNLVADKDVYVFDEATSNIDIESEAVIMENVREMSREKSVIVISHRLANVVPADNIYYMEDGEVKESGTHAELMRAQGGYAKLFNTQKELEEGYKDVARIMAKEARA
ncbi:MAG TPA: ABC transporter ATP-binding protein/permease [Candidatus Borkfalkia stercoripullorum]|nr:ABC transporter ATP-binding protein/permease [Candidatus Borkfalkia stercoripullorum]